MRVCSELMVEEREVAGVDDDQSLGWKRFQVDGSKRYGTSAVEQVIDCQDSKAKREQWKGRKMGSSIGAHKRMLGSGYFLSYSARFP